LWTTSQAADFDRYELHRSTTAGFTPSDDTFLNDFMDVSDTSFTDDELNDLASSTTYYYCVVTYNRAGQSSTSNQVQVTTADEGPRTPPTAAILTVNAGITPTRVPLSWSENQDETFEHYGLHRSITPDFTPTAATQVFESYNSEELQYVDSRLASQTTYYYKLVTVNIWGQSTVSNQVSATTSAAPVLNPPSAVTVTLGTAVSYDSVPLSWSQFPSPGFDRYEIHRSEQADFTPAEDTLVDSVESVDVTEYVDAGVVRETTYYYKVVVYDQAGQQAISSAAAVTTLAVPAPGAVTLSSTQATAGEVSLNWTHAPAPGFEAYELYRSTTPNFTPTDDTFVADFQFVDDDAYADTEVEDGVTYYYKMVTVNAIGETASSNEIQVASPALQP
jgi:titin